MNTSNTCVDGETVAPETGGSLRCLLLADTGFFDPPYARRKPKKNTVKHVIACKEQNFQNVLRAWRAKPWLAMPSETPVRSRTARWRRVWPWVVATLCAVGYSALVGYFSQAHAADIVKRGIEQRQLQRTLRPLFEEPTRQQMMSIRMYEFLYNRGEVISREYGTTYKNDVCAQSGTYCGRVEMYLRQHGQVQDHKIR